MGGIYRSIGYPPQKFKPDYGLRLIRDIRIRIRMARSLPNRRPNTVRDIPSLLLFISCLRLTMTITPKFPGGIDNI